MEQRIEYSGTVELAAHPGIQGRLGTRIELRLRLGILSKSAVGQRQRISDGGGPRRHLQRTLEVIDRGLEVAILQRHLSEPDQTWITRRI